jgi:PKHD-type hydroxylase
MIVAIPRLLPAELVATINREMDAAPHTSGNAAPGVRLESVKKNEELDTSSESFARLSEAVHAVLRDHRNFQLLTMPKAMVPFLFSRYRPGMFYGDHNDQAVMGRTTRIRTDMSVTIFLSDPASYDGGELVLDTDTSPRPFKLNPGDAVIYPTFSLHRVEAVRRGERRAAVTWIQSTIRLPEHRQALTDVALSLNWMINAMSVEQAHAHIEFRRLQKVRANLERLWAEP